MHLDGQKKKYMEKAMSVKIIAAVSMDGIIGKDNKIPWDYPEDMKFFRQSTAGATVIMGRLTLNIHH